MEQKLTQNLWERFGFADNPFDTRALSLSSNSSLPVEEAFVGRGQKSPEWTLLTNFFRNPGGGRIVVEGNVGVGKTTFVNYHRHRWQTHAKPALLTPASEISVQSDWGAREFMLSVMAALAGRIGLTMDAKDRQRDPLLIEVNALIGVLVTEAFGVSGGLQVLGTGLSGGRTRSTSIQKGEITPEAMRGYIGKLMDRVMNLRYAGAILHLDNLELLARGNPARLARFFDDIRDCLQTPQIYFVFVGYMGMFQEVIVPIERVRSIFFGHPVALPPLSREEVHLAIKKRYEILATGKARKWIAPVDDALVDYLYDIFAGKIRFIMDEITTLVAKLPDAVTSTLETDAAKAMLSQLTKEKVRSFLSETEQQVLFEAIRQKRFTNSSLGEATGKSKQNITKYINQFTKYHLVILAERKGRSTWYEIAPDLALMQMDSKR